MISEKMNSLMVEQMHREYESAFMYLSIANYYESNGMDGYARWYKIQSREETDHALLFYDYLQKNDAKVYFRDIQATNKKFHDFKEPLEEAYTQEQFITESIEKIYELAVHERDYGSQVFLNWFIQEQQEEEAEAVKQIHNLELYGNDSTNFLLLDRENGKRVYHGCKKIKNME